MHPTLSKCASDPSKCKNDDDDDRTDDVTFFYTKSDQKCQKPKNMTKNVTKFGGAENVEKKVNKFYDLLETTTAMIFQKKKAFEDNVDLETKEKGNKIPKENPTINEKKEESFWTGPELKILAEELQENGGIKNH